MWDIKCVAASLCFLTSNILSIVHGAILMRDHKGKQTDNANDGNANQYIYNAKENSYVKPVTFSFHPWKNLDPAYIENRWVEREAQRPLMMAAGLFGAMAWFWLMVAIVQSAWVLSRGGKRRVGPHMLLAALGVCGSIIELLARLLTVGMTNASQWLAKDFKLDDWKSEGDGTGWRVLEMIHIVTRGMLLWVDAFEALALFGIVVVLHYSVACEPRFRIKRSSSIMIDSENEEGADAVSGAVTALTEVEGGTPSSSPPPSAFAAVSSRIPIKPTFSKCFTRFGLFVGFLAVVDFLATVLRFVDWKLFGRIALATNALTGVVFLPIWLLCLGCQLPVATERFEREERRAAILLRGSEDEIAALKRDEMEIL